MAINNTPNIGPYTELKPFRFWCQKVLPLVYDESLSYYELLCKVIDYLNKTMEDVDQVTTDMAEFKAAYDELINYVNNYFNDLDVQEAINNKLDAMAEAGYFEDLFNTLFRSDLITEAANVTSAWIAENLMQETGYVIDKTLTVENAAADAKTVGDTFNEISEITRNIFFGPYANGNIDINNVEYAQTNYLRCVAYIPVEASTTYTLHMWSQDSFSQIVLMEYASDMSVATRRGIYSGAATTDRVQSFTTGSTTAFIRFILYSVNDIDAEGNKTQIEKGSSATEYIEHLSANDRELRQRLENDSNILNGRVLEDESVTILKTDKIFRYDYQFIKKDDIVTGKYYADNGSIQTVANYAVVPYGIPVKAGVTYYYRGLSNRNCLYINSVTQTISFFSNVISLADGDITPANDGFVYITTTYDNGVINPKCMFANAPLPTGRVENGYNVEVINGTQFKENIIEVSIDGTKDFTSLKAAFDSITDASEHNIYIVKVYPGTYDIKTYYTNAQWAIESTSFVGLTVPDHVYVEGIGNKEDVILTASDTSARQYISTLNMKNSSGLKNLTVKAEYLRYVIHDDYANTQNVAYERICENCIFEGENLYYMDVYGSAIKGNGHFKFINCKFINHDINNYGLSVHNHPNQNNAGIVDVINCRFDSTKGMRFRSITNDANGIINNSFIIGTKANTLRLEQENGPVYGEGCLWSASGYANDIGLSEVNTTDGLDYSNRIDLI